jgi:hypothetical protein
MRSTFAPTAPDADTESLAKRTVDYISVFPTARSRPSLAFDDYTKISLIGIHYEIILLLRQSYRLPYKINIFPILEDLPTAH